MYTDDTSDAGPRGTFETYRAEGDTLFKNGEYNKAIDSYTTALELRPGDKDCLVARSRCYLQLGNTEQALKDAETSLNEERNFHKGLFQKAEALYCKGEFELALVFYHRGHKMRPELQEFRLGIQKAQEAIDNSVGSPEKVRLTKEGDLAFFDALTEQPSKKGRSKPNYARPGTNSRKRAQVEYKSAANDKTVKQLLGELYGDRVYLEKLLKETENLFNYCRKFVRAEQVSIVATYCHDPQSQMGQNIYNLVRDGLTYLDTRTEFWRQQKPMYARKRDRITQRKTGSKDNKASANQYIIKELERIDEEAFDGKYQDSLKRAKKCMKTVQGYKEGIVHNKEDIVANLHSLIGNAYMELGELDKALHHHNIDMEMAKKHKMVDARSRALDNLGRVYARSGDYVKAIDVWEEKLPVAKSPLESTWLYHEMGRCYLEMTQFDKAKDFGEKSLAQALKAEDDMWQLNATVLMAQAETKLLEYELALGSFEKALDMAKLQGDASAESAIKRAIQDINNKIVHKLKAEKEPEPESNSPPPKSRSPSPAKSPSPEPQSEPENKDDVDGDAERTQTPPGSDDE